MPYTKEHKDKSKNRILESAHQLFTAKGYDGVTVNELMENCNLTRGAFYAHFSSKSSLYSETIKFSTANSKLAKLKPSHVSDEILLRKLLDGYLSIEHVNGDRPCPLAFLATDIATKDSDARAAYAKAYTDFNRIIMAYANSYTSCDENEVLSLTAMIIGAVAIARTMENKSSIKKLLASCRQEVTLKLGVPMSDNK